MELLKLAGCGDLDGVKRLIQQGVHVDTLNRCDETALYLACENGHTEVAQYLLDNGASVSLGAKPLIAAVKFRHYDCVKLLFEYNADANCTNARQESPMCVAMQNDDISMFILLIQCDTKPMASPSGMEAFDHAFKYGTVELAESVLLDDSYPQVEQLYPKAVYYSAKNNWPNILSKLIEKGVDINALTEGVTPLCAACEKGHEYVASLLLDNGADPNISNASGGTERLSAGANVSTMRMMVGISPLFSACVRGRNKLVQLLLSHGANPNTATSDNRYPLHAACEGLQYEAVKLLLEYNADVNVRDGTGKSALDALISQFLPGIDIDERTALVQLLLDGGANVNAESRFGETPLYIACSNGLDSIVRKMLECGADVDGNGGRKVPLNAACRFGHMSVVRTVMASGANPNLQDETKDGFLAFDEGYSLPLHTAAVDDNSELAELLLKHGADVDVADTCGNTALHHAVGVERYRRSASSGNAKAVVDILLENKADVNKVNNFDETPLHRAVSRGLLDVVSRMLHAHGGDPNKGLLPLVAACEGNDVKLVDMLLKHGADPNLASASCNTDSKHVFPLFAAVANDNSDIIRSLLNAGADVNAVDAEGKNAVCFAAEVLVRTRDSSRIFVADISRELSAIRLLVQHGANFNVQLPDGRSPLHLALKFSRLVPDTQRKRELLLQLMVNRGAMLHDSASPPKDDHILMALATFDGRPAFVVGLFRAGAGFQLLASYCNCAANGADETKSISLCQAAVLAGYVPSDEELQQLQLAAARDNEARHLIQQLVNWLNEDKQQPPSLLRQCRVAIRRQLSVAVRFQSVLPAIEQLDLPDVIREYLQFDGPLTEVDLTVRKEPQTS